MEVEGKRKDQVIPDQICDICSEGNGKSFCSECERHLCTPCFQQHVKTIPCREYGLNDFVSDRTTAEKEKIKCELHDEETIKFYCVKHETVGCGDCVFMNHKYCRVEYIKDIADRFMNNDKSASFKNKLKKIKKQLDYGLETVTIYQNVNSSSIKIVLEDIHKHRLEVDKIVDQAEEKLVAATNEIHDTNASHLQMVLDSYHKMQGQCEELEEVFRSSQIHHNKEFINVVKAKPILLTLEQTLEELQSNTKTNTYNFEPTKRRIKLELGFLEKKTVTYK